MEKADFQRFYEANFERIYRFVATRVGNRDLAEDLVSEVFLKAFRAFGDYDEAISRSSWIFTIARNHLVNHYRSSGRTVTDSDIESMPIAGEDFERAAERGHDVNTMLAALEAMPADKRALVRMKYLEQLSYEEMGERLGKEKGAVKVATFRAMGELRKALKERLGIGKI